MHGFADASKHAYGAVLYLHVVKNSKIYVCVQMAKTRVAPIKTVSIPRLELCAAQLLAKLTHHFASIMRLKLDQIQLWSDSQVMLYWLRDHPSRWPTFIANRCREIITLLLNAIWHHVKSGDNPADLASRGAEPSKLLCSKLWWSGPSWWTNSFASWSCLPSDNLPGKVDTNVTSYSSIVNQTRIESVNSGAVSGEIWELINKYSSVSKLFRITAYVLRFILKIRHRILIPRPLSRLGTQLLNHEFFYYTIISQYKSVSSQEIENAAQLWVYLQ